MRRQELREDGAVTPGPRELRAPAASAISINKIDNNGSHAPSSLLAGEVRHEPSRQLSQNRVALKSLAILLAPAPGAGHQAPCHLTCHDSRSGGTACSSLEEAHSGRGLQNREGAGAPPNPGMTLPSPRSPNRQKSSPAHPAGTD